MNSLAADSSAVFYSNGEEADFAIFAQYSLLESCNSGYGVDAYCAGNR